jgi:putative transposase
VPRIARVVAVGAPHHVTQAGNNRQQVFFSNNQRRSYLTLLAEHASRHGLRILGYCLMPNHVHAVVVPQRPDSMARGFGRAHNSYSRYFNTVRRRSGHVWQNRFYSAPLGREHLVQALRYVDLNPVRARLVDGALDYPWSSARAHVTGRDPSGLLDLDLWREVCPRGDWEGVLHEGWAADTGWTDHLRSATRAGKPLANSDFVSELESESGADLRLRRPGRPRKTAGAETRVRAARAS